MIVANNRVFVNEISVKKLKVGTSGSGKGHLFLFNDLLLIAQPSSTVKQRFNLICYLPYASSAIKVESAPKGSCFFLSFFSLFFLLVFFFLVKYTLDLTSSNLSAQLTFATDEEKDTWLSLIRNPK